MVSRFRGIHAVLYALFDADERLDRAAMAAQMGYVRACGADGVTVLGLATEVGKLSEAEKRQVIDWAAEDAGGMPMSVTVTGNSVAEQVALARYAESAGAACLVLQPPLAGAYGAGEYIDFFARVGAAVSVPFAVQNAPQYLGRSLTAADMAALAARCDGFTHVKAEGTAADLAALVAVAGERLVVLNGRGGLEMTDCLRAGAAGFIVAPDVLPGVVACWRAWEAGDVAGAEAAYRAFLPGALFGMQSLEHLICYGKRIFGWRAGIAVHDRAPAMRPTEAGLAMARGWV
jgi:4-hydroxy-tetrahydrodipicolinate synthase